MILNYDSKNYTLINLKEQNLDIFFDKQKNKVVLCANKITMIKKITDLGFLIGSENNNIQTFNYIIYNEEKNEYETKSAFEGLKLFNFSDKWFK